MNEVFDKVIGLCYTGNNYGKLVKTLDKEEFRIKLEEINKLVQNKDYKGAMNIVDSIDWCRVKNVRTLCVVGEIYAANGRYEDSKEIFLLAYHKASIGKNILYRLVEISLKMLMRLLSFMRNINRWHQMTALNIFFSIKLPE